MGTRRWFVVGAFILLFGLTAGPAPAEGGRMHWEGTAEAVLPNGLRVNGQTVLEGEIRPGMSVVIEGQSAPSSKWRASSNPTASSSPAKSR